MAAAAAPTPAPALLPQVPLGKHGLKVSRIGLGTMGMTAFYVQNPQEHEEEGLRTIARGLELGCNFLDTAWIYQNVRDGADGSKVVTYNEVLVGKAIKQHGRDKFVIATKFGIGFKDGKLGYDSTEANIRKQLAESLERLGTDYVDLYYQHRHDPNVPVEEVARVLEQLRVEGKIKYIGFSEMTAKELRLAVAVCPVSALQMEYSLQAREIEHSVIPTARELGVGIVAYSPLGRGLLSRTFKATTELAAGDFRTTLPRLQGEHAQETLSACEKLEHLADSWGLPPAQVALAWVLSRGEDIVPIPGSKAVARLEQNVDAAFVQLNAEQLEAVSAAVPQGSVPRYPDGRGGFEAREL